MTMKLAAPTDAQALHELSALCMAEPDFDIYPLSPMTLAQYSEQSEDQQWGICIRSGKARGIIWSAPSLLYGPQERFEVMAFYTDPTLPDAERRSVGLEMIIWEQSRRLAHGYKFCEFLLPHVNVKVRAFAEWVEPTPVRNAVAATDPLTGAVHYYRVVWDVAATLAKAKKLAVR